MRSVLPGCTAPGDPPRPGFLIGAHGPSATRSFALGGADPARGPPATVGFPLRHGQPYHRPAWTSIAPALAGSLESDQPMHHIVLEDCIAAAEAATARRDRLRHISKPSRRSGRWDSGRALQALRGVAWEQKSFGRRARRHHTLHQSTTAHGVSGPGAVGTLQRPQMTPRRHEPGGKGAARRMPIEAAWSYRFPPGSPENSCYGKSGCRSRSATSHGRPRSARVAAIGARPRRKLPTVIMRRSTRAVGLPPGPSPNRYSPRLPNE